MRCGQHTVKYRLNSYGFVCDSFFFISLHTSHLLTTSRIPCYCCLRGEMTNNCKCGLQQSMKSAEIRQSFNRLSRICANFFWIIYTTGTGPKESQISFCSLHIYLIWVTFHEVWYCIKHNNSNLNIINIYKKLIWLRYIWYRCWLAMHSELATNCKMINLRYVFVHLFHSSMCSFNKSSNQCRSLLFFLLLHNYGYLNTETLFV